MEGQYARTEGLAGVGREGMQRLARSSVAVVGLGGLGSAVAPVLVAQGVGRIALIDDDTVSLSNLPRQLLYGVEDVGCVKVERAAARLQRMAPCCNVEEHAVRFDCGHANLLRDVQLVLDCTDNFETQYLIDGLMSGGTVPVVWGAVEQYGGQVALLHGRSGVCLQDLFGEVPKTPQLKPVWPSLVHAVGQVMASEALAWLLGWECALDGALWTIDMRTYRTQVLHVA